ncbi:PAS domain S-box protein [Halovivax sp.]|uniref:PAS domain S-box protein n=1 Tax=Halovivax sp. TaxID=1935978 RepID=UPI0025B87DD0|nr:PAS domain S-box protein [Halovivax sp.]
MTSGSLTESLRETLATFDGSDEPRTTPEVAERLDLGRRSTYARLKRLVEHDRLETKKVGANARVWWRPPTNADATSPDREAAAGAPDDVLDAVDVGVVVLDVESEVVRINAAAERYLGLDRERDVGATYRRLVEERVAPVVEDPATFAETVAATPDADAEAEGFECRVTGGDGIEERWLDRRSEPIESGEYAGGRVERYVDITDRTRGERPRREDRAQFDSLIEAVEEYAIFRLDREGRVVTWNEGAREIKGYAADQILGEHVSTFYTDDDRDAGAPERNLNAAADRGSIREAGWRIRKDGSLFWANVTITAIRDDDGSLRGYAKVTRDTTDRRERERELRRERDLTERLLETAPVRLAVFRADGSVERINSRTRRALGIDETAASEFEIEDFDVYDADGDPISSADHPVPHVIETGEPVSDWLVQHDGPGGGRRWVSLTVTPLFDDDGAIERVVVAGKDVTALKRTERRLERQRDELRAELDEVFERVSDGFYALDEELRFRYLNDYARAAMGLDEFAIGADIREAVDLAEPLERALYEARDSQRPVAFEDYHDPVDGWFYNALYPSESGLSVYFREITDQKRRERELERYERIVETVDDGIFVLDGDRRFTAVNDGFVSLTGYERDELLGAAAELVFGNEFVEIADEKQVELESGELGVAVLEEELYRADGTSVAVESRFDRFAVGDGEAGRVGVVRDVGDRIERERELERQRERLAAVNSINEVVGEITGAVVDRSTREEIEQAVCDALAASDAYEFAWLAAVDSTTDTFEPRATAGTRGYADEITISMDSDEPTSEGPGATAVRERETQVVRDVFADPAFEPWRDAAAEYGFSAVAAIPVVHEGTVYGVLGVYADRPNAFDRVEQDVVGQIGAVVGHAIAAAERKRALLSDELVELEFRIPDAFSTVDVAVDTDGTITLDHAVPVGDDQFLVYGTATPDALDAVTELVEALPSWGAVTVRSDGDPIRFELEVSDPPILSVVASLGGYIDRTVIEDGDVRLAIHLAPTAEVRHVIDVIAAEHPQAEMLRRHQISRQADDPQRIHRRLVTELTERQRASLEAAYRAGFFEWPRETSAEGVAESLGVAPPTFHQHLRKAQRKAFDLLFAPTT